MQPTQQHGRFWPSNNSSTVRLIRRALVFSCLASSTQHRNSLRAIGVIASHKLVISLFFVSATTKSLGSECTSPPDIVDLFMIPIYYILVHCCRDSIVAITLEKVPKLYTQ